MSYPNPHLQLLSTDLSPRFYGILIIRYYLSDTAPCFRSRQLTPILWAAVVVHLVSVSSLASLDNSAYCDHTASWVVLEVVA
jgi:hypothetical protein